MYKQMMGKLVWGVLCVVLCMANARAEYEPNDNYSTFVLSFRSVALATPVCLGGECHDRISGPAIYYAKQVVPNLALGLYGTQLTSSGRSSSIKDSNGEAFAQFIAGMGNRVDLGATVGILSGATEYCTSNPNNCDNVSDNGASLGVFGKIFFTEKRTLSLALSYNNYYYQKLQNQSVIGLTLVSIIAKHHRLSLYADQVREFSGSNVSSGLGVSYSYLIYY